MPGDPIFNDVHGILQHEFIFGEVINEQCDELIGKGNLRFLDDIALHTKKSVIIETWHVQGVMEGSSDSGIGIKFLIILIHSTIFRRCFDIARSDKMFLPIFDVIEFNNVNQSLGSYHQSLDHLFCSIFTLIDL